MKHYFICYKPYLVLSQFTTELNKQTLANYFSVPKNVYSVGRLDEASEGLLILTDDEKLNHRLLDPSFAHTREYWVQVDGTITQQAIIQLQYGVEININNKQYTTKESIVSIFEEPPLLPDRHPPVRFRKNISTTWIKIILSEGKNRQIRKMTAKVGFPVLRLVRYRIEDLELNSLQPGEMIELSRKTIYKKLFHE